MKKHQEHKTPAKIEASEFIPAKIFTSLLLLVCAVAALPRSQVHSFVDLAALIRLDKKETQFIIDNEYHLRMA